MSFYRTRDIYRPIYVGVKERNKSNTIAGFLTCVIGEMVITLTESQLTEEE